MARRKRRIKIYFFNHELIVRIPISNYKFSNYNDMVFNQKMFHVLNHFKFNLIYIGINSSNHYT